MRKVWQTLLALLLLSIVMSGCSSPLSAPASSPPELIKETFVFDKETRVYYVHLPPGYGAKSPLSLVLSLHGAGGSGAVQAALTGFDAVADSSNFIVVYPEAPGGLWSFLAPPLGTRDDLGYIQAVVAQVEAKYAIDRKRIYANGISEGGFFSVSLACSLSQEFAAIAEVAATMMNVQSVFCRPRHPMPVLTINGTADPLIHFTGGKSFGVPYLSAPDNARRWAQLAGCVLTPTQTTLPDKVNDGTHLILYTYDRCKNGAAVSFYEVIGGGHTWPGGWPYLPVSTFGKTSGQMNASQVMWDFFRKYSL